MVFDARQRGCREVDMVLRKKQPRQHAARTATPADADGDNKSVMSWRRRRQQWAVVGQENRAGQLLASADAAAVEPRSGGRFQEQNDSCASFDAFDVQWSGLKVRVVVATTVISNRKYLAPHTHHSATQRTRADHSATKRYALLTATSTPIITCLGS